MYRYSLSPDWNHQATIAATAGAPLVAAIDALGHNNTGLREMYTNVGIYFDLGCGVFGFLSFCFGPVEGLGYVGIHR